MTRSALAVLLLGAALAAPLPAQAGPAGIIQPGDRVLLAVTGEAQLSDTFIVAQDLTIDLPVLGTVPLRGVARDSIQPVMATFLAKYLTHPIVRAQVLLRLGVMGEVVKPGFYALPSGAAIQDLIMAAGGMSPMARFDKSKLRRDRETLMDGAEVRQAVTDGKTFDALALRSGDALEIPRRPDPESRVRLITGLIALPVAIYGLTRLF